MINITNKRSSILTENEALINSVLNGTLAVYLFGWTSYSRNVVKSMNKSWKIAGIIDEFTEASDYEGIPVVNLKQVSPEQVIIQCVIEGRPKTVAHLLTSKGYKKV